MLIWKNVVHEIFCDTYNLNYKDCFQILNLTKFYFTEFIIIII